MFAIDDDMYFPGITQFIEYHTRHTTTSLEVVQETGGTGHAPCLVMLSEFRVWVYE